MKKFWICLCVMVLCLSISGCCLSHDWAAATCTSPETCTKCGEIQGEALGHEKGDFVVTETDLIAALVKYEARCTRCGELLDTKEEPLTKLYDEETGLFMITPEEFLDRLEFLVSSNDSSSVIDRYEMNDNDGEYCSVDCIMKSSYVAAVSFFDKNGNVITDADSREVATVQYVFWLSSFRESVWPLAEMTAKQEAKLMANVLDPDFENSGMVIGNSSESTPYNGIKYFCNYLSKDSLTGYFHIFYAPAGQQIPNGMT